MALPTILLITGAFTTTACYDWLAPHLEKAGFPVPRATLISTTPADPHSCTAEKEGANLLNNHVRPLVEAGQDVVIFAHSLGATTCSGAGSGLTKHERRQAGKSGGIIGLIWNTCAFPRDGASQHDFLGGGEWPPFVKMDTPGPGLIVFDNIIHMLYNDVDASLQLQLEQSALPTAISVFTTPVKAPLWTESLLDGRKVYILTLQDNTFPAEAQMVFLAGTGVNWDVRELDAGHEAFISRPGDVAEVIIDAARKWSE